MFNLSRIYAQNFFSYPEMGICFRGRPFVMINSVSLEDGDDDKSNGYGKSTVCEAISYALYGKLLRTQGVRVAPYDLIRHGEDSMKIVVELDEIEKENKIRIERTLTLSGKRQTKLFYNDKERQFDKKSDVDNSIQEWLGIDFDMLMRRFLAPDTISFISLKPSERFKCLSSLMTFNWDKVNTAMLKQSKKAKTELDNLEEELQRIEVKKTELNGKRELAEYREKNWETQLEAFETNLGKLQKKLKKKAEILEQIKETETQHNEDNQEVEKRYRTLKTQIDKLESKIESLDWEDPQKQYAEQFKGIGEIECPKCQTVIDSQDIADKLANVRQTELDKQKEALVPDLNKLEEEFEGLQEEYDAAKNLAKELQSERVRLNSTIKQIKSEIQSLEHEKKKVDREKKQCEDIDLKTIEKQLKELEKLKETNDETYDTLLDGYHSYQIVKNASQASSPARLMSVNKLTPFLSHGVSRVASHMFGRPIDVVFRVQDKELEIDSETLSLATMSTGERKSFDIAVSVTMQELALQTSRNQIGFEILDEIFDGLDKSRIRAAVNLIRGLNIPQLIVITHDIYAKELLEMMPGVSVLQISNEDGVSKALFREDS